MPKILVVDDNEEVLELIKAGFSLRNFEVVDASSGERGLALAKDQHPDIVILDLMLPDMDGLQVCAALKKDSDTKDIPILMLTARERVLDKVKGLESGADDYLVKPFDMLELIARVNARLRDRGLVLNETKRPIKIGAFEIDPSRYVAHQEGQIIDNLTPREFEILYLLMKNSPNPISREDIFQAIWDKSEKKYSRVIDIHIARIRRKIKPQEIKTIPGKGYFFPPGSV